MHYQQQLLYNKYCKGCREALAIFKNASVLDPNISCIPDVDIGSHLFDSIARFLDGLSVPRGLEAVGYKSEDIPQLVKGTLPQRRVLDLAPGIGDVIGEEGQEYLTRILEKSLKY